MRRAGIRAQDGSADDRAPAGADPALGATIDSGQVDPALQETASGVDLALDAPTAPGVDTGPPRPVDPAERPLSEDGFEQRYQAPRLLGLGGMGEVVATTDVRVGREVALKRMRHDADGELEARFVREARIQAQLEHPAIVPVYDLGIQPDGEPYFTMKRLRGQTLAARLAAEAGRERDLQPSGRELLTRFADICLAVEYAHQRGVIHRDLKPGNIMLGDFGEAYVLDWGIAKAAGAVDATSGAGLSVGETAVGAVMGTAGYLAPEQLAGAELDARADVYSLGCILFEILSLEPLHRGETVAELIASTRRQDRVRPSERAPDRQIPPELDAICARATAADPDQRYPSARTLHDELARFLEGDRDLRRRRELAARHAERAAAAAREDGLAARRQAMREAGRALALDPDNRRALELIGQLVIEPPEEMPAEVESELRDAAMRSASGGARLSIVAYSIGLVLIGVGALLGLRDPVLTGSLTFFMVGGIGWAAATLKTRHLEPVVWCALMWQALFLVLLGRMFGPLVVVPGVAAVAVVDVIYHGVLRRPWLAVGVQVAAIVVPFALEEIGVLAASYAVEDGQLLVRSQFFHFRAEVIYLILAVSVAVLVILSAIVIALRRDNLRNQRLLGLQAWHLRQLVPDEVARPPMPEADDGPRCSIRW